MTHYWNPVRAPPVWFVRVWGQSPALLVLQFRAEICARRVWMNHNGFCLLRLRLNLVLSVWCWCKYKKLRSGWRHVRRLASLSCRSAVWFWIKEQSPHSFNISGNTPEEDGTVLWEDESGCEEEKKTEFLPGSKSKRGRESHLVHIGTKVFSFLFQTRIM